MTDSIYIQRNGVTNHWGIWVNPDKAITGVISNNEIIQFLCDEVFNGINLDYEEHIQSFDHNEDYCEICEYWEDLDSTYLIGDWLFSPETGLYDYDPDGEYAAIVRESTTQVVYSKYTKRAGLCSPCYPGQADNESEGKFLAYDLPSEAYEIY